MRNGSRTLRQVNEMRALKEAGQCELQQISDDHNKLMRDLRNSTN